MNTFKHAREAMRFCTDKVKREQLRERTDEAQEAFDRFTVSASRDDMQILVACWTRMLIALDRVGPCHSPVPSGAGRLRPPLKLPSTGDFEHDPDIYDVVKKLTKVA
jgi:hypothetical protein